MMTLTHVILVLPIYTSTVSMYGCAINAASPSFGTTNIHFPRVSIPFQFQNPTLRTDGAMDDAVPAVMDDAVPAVMDDAVPAIMDDAVPAPAIVHDAVPAIVDGPVPAIVDDVVPAIVDDPVPAIVDEIVPAIVDDAVPAIVDEIVPAIVDDAVPDILVPLLAGEGEHGNLQQEEINGASFTGAVLNLSTTIMGGGIMALAAVMKVLGLGPGVVITLIFAFFTRVSVDLLLGSRSHSRPDSYGSVMEEAWGIRGRRILECCVVINNIGSLIVYTITIADVLSGSSSSGVHHAGILEVWFGEHWWNTRFVVLVVTTLFVYTPLARYRDLDPLRVASAIAILLAFVFLLVTMVIVVVQFSQGSIAMPRFLPHFTDTNSIWGLFTVVPVLLTAYVCQFNVHTIRNELRHRENMLNVVRTSLALCSTIYIMTGCFCFLLFGDSTLDDVLSNFDTNLGFPYSAIVVRVIYIVQLMFTFPMVFHPLRLNLDGLLFPAPAPSDRNNIRFNLETIGLISVIFLGAIFIPSVWYVLEITGATVTALLSFIFPVMISLRDPRNNASRNDRICGVFMVAFAGVSCSIALYCSFHKMFLGKRIPSRMMARLGFAT